MDDQTTEYALVAEQTKTLVIQTNADYARMAEAVLVLKKAVAYFEDLYRPRIKQSDDTTKALRADMRKLQEPATQAIEYANGELTRWRAVQDEIARKQAIADAEAQRKAEEEKRLQLAELAEQAGEKKLAEEILNAPSEEPIITIQSSTPKVTGLSFRDDWLFQITDAAAIPREYLVPDEVKIGKIVRAMKQGTNIPGIKVYSKQIAVGRK